MFLLLPVTTIAALKGLSGPSGARAAGEHDVDNAALLLIAVSS
jgi:hypothetical protein